MTDNSTPIRHIRMADDVWKPLGEIAAAVGMSRAGILNELARWYRDEYGKPAMPNLPIPPRPPAE